MVIAIGVVILAFAAMLVYRFFGDKLGLIDRSKLGVAYVEHPGFISVKSVMMMVVSLIVLG